MHNILSDPFKLIEILDGVFAIIGGLYAAGVIAFPWWRTWRERRSLRKRLGAELYTPIQQLNVEKYGGYDDWRLPTLEEAMSLMEYEKKTATYSLLRYLAKRKNGFGRQIKKALLWRGL